MHHLGRVCADWNTVNVLARTRGHRGPLLVVALALMGVASTGLSGCAPIPLDRYVPEADGGRVVYSVCSFNKHVPEGVAYTIQEVQVIVKVRSIEKRLYAEAQFIVPSGNVLRLQSERVQYSWKGSQTTAVSLFPKISRVENPIVNMNSDIVANQELMMGVLEPMVGGTFQTGSAPPSANRNFWTAAYLDGPASDEIRVTLPPLEVNRVAVRIPEIHFRRTRMLGVALFNC